MGTLPLMDVLAHDPLAAGKPVLGDQPVENPFGGVALLARRRQIRRQPGVDDRRDGIEDRPRFRFVPSVAAGLGLVTGEDLADDPAAVVQLAGDRPHALVVDEVGPAYGFALLHRQHPVLPLAGALRPQRSGLALRWAQFSVPFPLRWVHF